MAEQGADGGTAIGLDSRNVEVLDVIDGCAVIVQENLSELGLE